MFRGKYSRTCQPSLAKRRALRILLKLPNDHHLSRRNILVGIATSLVCAPTIVRSASLMRVHGVVMPMGRLHWELDHPGEPYPYEGFVRRLFFYQCDSALKAGRPGNFVYGEPLTEEKMSRIVSYARRYGFLR